MLPCLSSAIMIWALAALLAEAMSTPCTVQGCPSHSGQPWGADLGHLTEL